MHTNKTYLSVRDLILEINESEAYPHSITLMRNENSRVEKVVWYPHILIDVDTFQSYCKRVSKARKDYEPFLSNKASSYLFVLEKYLVELASFIGNNHAQQLTKELGLFVSVDLNRIQKDFDLELTKQINRPLRYLESADSHNSRRLKNRFMKKYIENSMLIELYNGQFFQRLSTDIEDKDNA